MDEGVHRTGHHLHDGPLRGPSISQVDHDGGGSRAGGPGLSQPFLVPVEQDQPRAQPVEVPSDGGAQPPGRARALACVTNACDELFFRLNN